MKYLVVSFILILTLFFITFIHSFSSNFIITYSSTLQIFLVLQVFLIGIISLAVLNQTSRNSYRKKSAEFLSRLFDESPNTFLETKIHYTKEGCRYSPDEDKLYFNFRYGYGKWVHELAHQHRFRKGLSRLKKYAKRVGNETITVEYSPLEEEIIGQMVESIVSDYSYRKFYKKVREYLGEAEKCPYPINEIGKRKLLPYIIGHTIASLYRRGKISFDEIKRISNLDTEKVMEEALTILEKNEKYIPRGVKELLNKI